MWNWSNLNSVRHIRMHIDQKFQFHSREVFIFMPTGKSSLIINSPPSGSHNHIKNDSVWILKLVKLNFEIIYAAAIVDCMFCWLRKTQTMLIENIRKMQQIFFLIVSFNNVVECKQLSVRNERINNKILCIRVKSAVASSASRWKFTFIFTRFFSRHKGKPLKFHSFKFRVLVFPPLERNLTRCDES